MKSLIIGEIVVTVLAGISFLAMFWSDPHSREDHPGIRAARRHLIAATIVVIAEGIGLALLGFGIRVPMWLFAVCYGAAAAVMVHRNILLIRARRLP